MDAAVMKQSHSARNAWATALLLALLVAATVGLLAAILTGLGARDIHVLELGSGTTDASTPDTWTERRWGRADNTSDTTHDTSWQPGFEVVDANGAWSQDAQIDLFLAAYQNENGETTVLSEDGEARLIAPGTENDYTFSLHNSGNVRLSYNLHIDSLFDEDEEYDPILVRLKKGDEWVVGGDDAWEPSTALDKYEEEGLIDAGRYYTYTLWWRWPFEDKDNLDEIDQKDTALGRKAVDEDIDYKVNILVNAEADEDGDEEGESAGNKSSSTGRDGGYGSPTPQTGDSTWRMIVVSGCLALIAVALLLIANRLRRK